MIQLNNYNLLNRLFKIVLIFFCSVFYFINVKFAFSQNTNPNQEKVNSVTLKNNIEVSTLEKPSLGSIGIKTEVNKMMGLDVWQGMNAKNIVEHLNYIPDIVSSKHLQIFLNDLYLSASNPPKGNSEEIIKFLETRLVKIKSSGQSKKLYQLVKQLPKGKRWKLWQHWLIEYELLNRQDKKACKQVNKKSKIDADHFWQMAKIFCLSIDGKLSQSEFILDLIKSRGFSDWHFENLFKILNGEIKDYKIDDKKNKLKPLHIIMMDTLKIPIKVNFIANLGIEYTDSLLSLTYLTPKARSFLLDRKINYNVVSSDQIIENYKSVSDGTADIVKAFANYKKKPNGFNRANIWLSIITLKEEIKKAESILKFIRLERKNGRFYNSIDLYLPILEKIDSASLTQDLNASIQKLKIANKPNLYPENDLANILMLKKGKTWSWDLILEEKAWPIIPILEQSQMKEPTSLRWLENINNFKDKNFEEDQYNKWNNSFNLNKYILTKSIEEAANNDKKSLTVLLIARLISNNPLVDFDLVNLLKIRRALFKIGLDDLSKKITLEVMTSKFISI